MPAFLCARWITGFDFTELVQLCMLTSMDIQPTGVPRRHAPEWVEKEAARTQRYYGGQPNRSDA
jgi:hypothetical protein